MTGAIARLASIKFTIIYSSANFWSKLSKGELTYGQGSASGVKMQGNKVRLKFNVISILVDQHFIINAWLLSISIYQTQLSIIHNQHTWASTINIKLNLLSEPLKHTT
jgi:hypothetical protein